MVVDWLRFSVLSSRSPARKTRVLRSPHGCISVEQKCQETRLLYDLNELSFISTEQLRNGRGGEKAAEKWLEKFQLPYKQRDRSAKHTKGYRNTIKSQLLCSV